jgi:hypothetical protein
MKSVSIGIGNHVLYKNAFYQVTGFDEANELLELKPHTGKVIQVFLNEVIRLSVEDEIELAFINGTKKMLHAKLISRLLV